MPKTYTKSHTVHGIDFIRSGQCNRCGECNCEKLNCGHFSWVAGKSTCAVQNSKEEVCDHCTNDPSSSFYNKGKPVTHQTCAEFPNHPWLNVIKDGVCGYTFKRIDVLGNESLEPLPFQDI